MVSEAYEFFHELLPEYDFNSEELRRTPERYVNMMKELTTPHEFTFTKFENVNKIDEMVIVQDIPFYTLCAHHLIPFYGQCHIAYIPNRYIVGLSKIPRAVKHFMRGLWSQENLTDAIANFLIDELDPVGVAVMMRGEHMCMVIRGVEVQGTITTTSAMRGAFLDTSKQARAEFLTVIGTK